MRRGGEGNLEVETRRLSGVSLGEKNNGLSGSRFRIGESDGDLRGDLSGAARRGEASEKRSASADAMLDRREE